MLIDKRTDKMGLNDEMLEYLSKVPTETSTEQGQDDWERTRPIPIYDQAVAQVKWQAVSSKR